MNTKDSAQTKIWLCISLLALAAALLSSRHALVEPFSPTAPSIYPFFGVTYAGCVLLLAGAVAANWRSKWITWFSLALGLATFLPVLRGMPLGYRHDTYPTLSGVAALLEGRPLFQSGFSYADSFPSSYTLTAILSRVTGVGVENFPRIAPLILGVLLMMSLAFAMNAFAKLVGVSVSHSQVLGLAILLVAVGSTLFELRLNPTPSAWGEVVFILLFGLALESSARLLGVSMIICVAGTTMHAFYAPLGAVLGVIVRGSVAGGNFGARGRHLALAALVLAFTWTFLITPLVSATFGNFLAETFRWVDLVRGEDLEIRSPSADPGKLFNLTLPAFVLNRVLLLCAAVLTVIALQRYDAHIRNRLFWLLVVVAAAYFGLLIGGKGAFLDRVLFAGLLVVACIWSCAIRIHRKNGPITAGITILLVASLSVGYYTAAYEVVTFREQDTYRLAVTADRYAAPFRAPLINGSSEDFKVRFNHPAAPPLVISPPYVLVATPHEQALAQYYLKDPPMISPAASAVLDAGNGYAVFFFAKK